MHLRVAVYFLFSGVDGAVLSCELYLARIVIVVIVVVVTIVAVILLGILWAISWLLWIAC